MDILVKTLKIALGSTLAVMLAELLGLKYASSAGIITLLTIQDTRLQTYQLTGKRLLSFVITILISVIISPFIESHTIGFGCFIFILVGLSLYKGWDSSISVNAVFGTHFFVMKESVTAAFVLNEAAILLIGTGIALVINHMMPNKEKELKNDLNYVENEMRGIMLELAEHISKHRELQLTQHRVSILMDKLDHFTVKAMKHKDNTLKDHAVFYMEYFVLRKNQCIIYLHLCRSFLTMDRLHYGYSEVTEFLDDFADSFSVKHDVDMWMNRLQDVITRFNAREMPSCREEFQARAMLFYMLKEMEEFLKLKMSFLESLSEEQMKVCMESGTE